MNNNNCYTNLVINKENALKFFMKYLKEKKLFGIFMKNLYYNRGLNHAITFLEKRNLSTDELNSLINRAFRWADTPQGYNFWYKEFRNFRKLGITTI